MLCTQVECLLASKSTSESYRSYRSTTLLFGLGQTIETLSEPLKLVKGAVRSADPKISKMHDLIQLDQRGGKARSLGSIDNLFIDKAILEDCINNHKNLSCAWYDVRKAYDSVSHQWILKCPEIHRVPKNLCDFIQRLIISRNITSEVRTDKGLELIGPIDILRGILQGDSFCVTLFILGFNPVAWYLGRQKDIKCLQ